MPAESEAVILALTMGENNMIKPPRASTDIESSLVSVDHRHLPPPLPLSTDTAHHLFQQGIISTLGKGSVLNILLYRIYLDKVTGSIWELMN